MERLDLFKIGYIFEHELSATYITDLDKFCCVDN